MYVCPYVLSRVPATNANADCRRPLATLHAPPPTCKASSATTPQASSRLLRVHLSRAASRRCTITNSAGAAIQHEASSRFPLRVILSLGHAGLSWASLVAGERYAYGVSRSLLDVIAIPARGVGSKPFAKGQDDGRKLLVPAFGLPHGCAPSPSRNRQALSLSRCLPPPHCVRNTLCVRHTVLGSQSAIVLASQCHAERDIVHNRQLVRPFTKYGTREHDPALA
jgi:hypothetical protein